MIRRLGVALAVIFFSWSPPAGATEFYQLTIRSGDVEHVFRVELAASDAERGKGLMFRRSLEPDQGMLFDFDGERQVSMWMRNTYIPLDMVFAGEDRIIHRIEARTEPFSETIIKAGAPTRYVFEVNAGTMARLGIVPGDQMIVPGSK